MNKNRWYIIIIMFLAVSAVVGVRWQQQNSVAKTEAEADAVQAAPEMQTEGKDDPGNSVSETVTGTENLTDMDTEAKGSAGTVTGKKSSAGTATEIKNPADTVAEEKARIKEKAKNRREAKTEQEANSSEMMEPYKLGISFDPDIVYDGIIVVPDDATPGQVKEMPHPIIGDYVETKREHSIYSYVQIPKNFYPDPKWTGDWPEIEAGGQQFFYFGCGICCLSNMYSTLTGTAVTPDKMFYIAKDASDYYPESGTGAISWEQLSRICKKFCFNVNVKSKPAEYETFQNDVKNSDTTMVLVCKDDDDKLWFYTNGHYVNLWNYDSATDSVFVTDPSGLFNRARLRLEDIYNALKSRSDAQYMTVKGTE